MCTPLYTHRHPDKNRGDEDRAAEGFRRLAAAYQRLTSPSDAQAWEDLDLCEVLTEDFFAEAFQADLPPFELMYMWVLIFFLCWVGPLGVWCLLASGLHL